MLSFRRAVVLSVFLLFCIFYLYPRSPRYPHDPEPTPGHHTSGDEDASRESEGRKPSRPHIPKEAKQQQQLSLAEIRNLPVTEQLAYQFPYQVSSKFPAYIWQTWKFTPASPDFEERFRITEASWTEKHPTFVHEVITDLVAKYLIEHLYSAIPDVLEAYRALPLPILKADFFRYLILLARGGIYSDIDTLALQPAPDWVSSNFKLNQIGLVIGIEADPDRPDWADWYSRRVQFCQWTIQSKPGHPVLREIVADITMETLRRKKAGKLQGSHNSVIEWTGPAAWTDAIFKYFNDPKYFDMSSSKGEISWRNFTGMEEPKKVGDVVVLPITSFSPGIGHSGAKDEDHPMAFVKHEFEGSWKPESERVVVPVEEAQEQAGQ
ncbi:Glycosyltransferase Family 32 protein [Tuber magnatum]|uniref:Glycosyltransferase Family 32 protein n=1 Tax=Tuber magnatum TaxID=42249 RepID=A0A317SKR6_9PEZI|nr:Glycosyltransferase Family 32 protein [Tuber magnatum]